MAARANGRQHTTSAKVASREEHGWDTSLHLPPWVSSNEGLQIEAKLDQWVRDLCQVMTDKPECTPQQCCSLLADILRCCHLAPLCLLII